MPRIQGPDFTAHQLQCEIQINSVPLSLDNVRYLNAKFGQMLIFSVNISVQGNERGGSPTPSILFSI